MRQFHVRRTARERYAIVDVLLGLRGDLLITDLAAIRRLAARMNADRSPGAAPVAAGEIGALGLIHEVGHLLIERSAEGAGATRLADALDAERRRDAEGVHAVLDRFGVAFPGVGEAPEPALVRLEELLLTRVSNENPALGPLRELVDDRVLAEGAPYDDVIAGLERSLRRSGEADPDAPDGGSAGIDLVDWLRAPARHAPTSLIGQLRYVREHWGALLGQDLEPLLARLDIAIGVLGEEERALHLRFGGAGPVATADRVVAAPTLAGLADEPEAFSLDSAWMPQLVLVAKSTYVWLDQLSRRYGRDIRTLDAIPDDELDILARWGITGLWLIGLWQRSVASARIKQMRGNAEAVASAYSLDDYRIADDLGGEAALADLRARAGARGIRLASDMVPNHMGIDSSWVIEHPEWFLSLPEPPYPAYAFSGADLSTDERVGIVLEDHYWDDTDAAVVFKRVDRATGDERFIYHGNDGTSFAWNDTAQLDFLAAEVREHVIEVILDVARRFPVIRFDAAMVLARRHIQRLWWPLPGSGDGIPSRAEHALSQAEFDARMPGEFWREVVDRVAAEVPGTLLLAEAFWMLEGYFVRSLGMHRVYNSAFMHMLRDENVAGYRKIIRETLEFDPDILKRYVNFMSNPDEETALEQFGSGDKYFGVASVLATLPGLPMFGHGQIEGFGEKYGMEFRRARLDERPDDGLIERHEREIFPLLHRRAWFADAGDFLLYDYTTASGAIDEHVLAYSNGSGPSRSLVLFHDRFGSTRGAIHRSVAAARKGADGTKRLVRRSLAEGLGLPTDPATFVTFADARSGLTYLRSCHEIHERGLELGLDAYQGHVFWEFREVADGPSGQWRRLAERLGGRGVASLDEAIRDLDLEPVHRAVRALFDGGEVATLLAGSAGERDTDALQARLATVAASVAAANRDADVADRVAADGEPADMVGASVAARLATLGSGARQPLDPAERAALLGWILLSPLSTPPQDAEGAKARASAAWFDDLRLRPVVTDGWRANGLDAPAAEVTTGLLRALLVLPRPSSIRGRGRTLVARTFERWFESDEVREAVGVHASEGIEYIDRDRLVGLIRAAVHRDALETGDPIDQGTIDRLVTAVDEAGDRVDRLVRAGGPRGRRRTP